MKPILENLITLNMADFEILLNSYEQAISIYYNLKGLGYKSVDEDFTEEKFLSDIKSQLDTRIVFEYDYLFLINKYVDIFFYKNIDFQGVKTFDLCSKRIKDTTIHS